jgi:hypothetical protein
MIIPRSAAIIAAIKTNVSGFMQSIRDGIEPPVDFMADSDAVMTLAALKPLAPMTLPPEMATLFAQFEEAKANAAQAEAVRDAAKAELVKFVIDNSGASNEKCIATCGKYKMTISKIADTPPTVIDESMIGQSYGGRKGHARVTISTAKEK